MRAHIDWLVRMVVTPSLLGSVVISTGTLGYILFCPGVYWAVGGQSGRLSPFLLTAALIGALVGAGLGLCMAADRAANEGAAQHLSPPRSLAVWQRHLRRPRSRHGRERRRLAGRSRWITGAARAGQ
jgi:hypothetical protein